MRLVAILLCLLAQSPGARAEIASYVERAALFEEIGVKTRAYDFAGVDAAAEAARKSGARFSDGRWKLAAVHTVFSATITELLKDDSAWPRVQRGLQQLVRRHVSSASAWLSYACALDAEAWRHRGDGFAAQVTPEGWAGFTRYEAAARAVLEGRRRALSADPEWYVLRLDIAVSTGEPAALIDALYDEGARRYPAYLGIFHAAMRHHQPHWGGSVAEMAAFIRASTKYATGAEGLSMVARLAWLAEQDGYWQINDDPAIDWTLMKRSFDDVLHAYPDDWNTQHFFFQACEHADKPESLMLLDRVQGPPSEALLGRNVDVYKMCADWARGKVPAFILRDPETGEKKLIQ